MRFVYFTKSLRELDIGGLIGFLKETGLDGADLAVRPGYPVHPGNVGTELPTAGKRFKDEGLMIGLVTVPTSLNNPEAAETRAIFEACAKAGVPAVKIGYFPYQGEFDKGLADARRKLAKFAELSAKTGVKTCYHTHSGNNYGCSAATLRMLLQDLDPHHVGAFLDTGHVAVNGGPIRMELDLIRPWLSLVAVKDVLWEKKKEEWKFHVVPAGEGIVKWKEVAEGIKECRFNGTVSLHGEYETKDMGERKGKAKSELSFLRSLMG